MSVAAKLRRAPMRLVTGAFILNSGIGKFSADEQTAKGLHGMAVGAYPMLDRIDPKMFVRGLAVAETALGTSLLAPVVSARTAGASLMAFSGSLLGMWWRTPGMHEQGSPRPTSAGIAIAKDSWMFGIGTSLLVDGLLSDASGSRRKRRARRKQARAQRTAEIRVALNERGGEVRAAAREAARTATHTAQGLADSGRDLGRGIAHTARESAADAAKSARESAAEVARTARESAAEAAKSAREGVADATKSAREAVG